MFMSPFRLNFFPEEITRISSLLERKMFCVINGDDELEKNEVEKLLVSHGAKIHQSPSDEVLGRSLFPKSTSSSVSPSKKFPKK